MTKHRTTYNLLDWRKKRRMSQMALAVKLSEFAGRKVNQSSICAWEKGVMPHAFWRKVLAEFSRNRINPATLGLPCSTFAEEFYGADEMREEVRYAQDDVPEPDAEDFDFDDDGDSYPAFNG